MYLFREDTPGLVGPEDRLPLLRRGSERAGWIASQFRDLPEGTPLFFDALTRILIPRWSAGRRLIGDACGCPTLAAGQGSHSAMAGAYVLAANSWLSR